MLSTYAEKYRMGRSHSLFSGLVNFRKGLHWKNIKKNYFQNNPYKQDLPFPGYRKKNFTSKNDFYKTPINLEWRNTFKFPLGAEARGDEG